MSFRPETKAPEEIKELSVKEDTKEREAAEAMSVRLFFFFVQGGREKRENTKVFGD